MASNQMVLIFFVVALIALVLHLAEAAPAPQLFNPQGFIDAFKGLVRILRKQFGLLSI